MRCRWGDHVMRSTHRYPEWNVNWPEPHSEIHYGEIAAGIKAIWIYMYMRKLMNPKTEMCCWQLYLLTKFTCYYRVIDAVSRYVVYYILFSVVVLFREWNSNWKSTYKFTICIVSHWDLAESARPSKCLHAAIWSGETTDRSAKHIHKYIHYYTYIHTHNLTAHQHLKYVQSRDT